MLNKKRNEVTFKNYRFILNDQGVLVYTKALDLDNREYWKEVTTYGKESFMNYKDPGVLLMIKELFFNDEKN